MSEVIRKEDIGEMPEGLLESIPNGDGLKVIDVVKEKIDWSPLEDDKVVATLDKIHSGILSFIDADHNMNKSSQFCWKPKGIKRLIANVDLSKTGAKMLVYKANGKKSVSTRYKISDEGIFDPNGERIKPSALLKKIKAWVKAKGWA